MKLSIADNSEGRKCCSMMHDLDVGEPEHTCEVGNAARPLGMADIQLLTVVEVARTLAIGRSSVYELMYRGDLKSVKIGGCRRIRYSDLGEYVRFLDDAS